MHIFPLINSLGVMVDHNSLIHISPAQMSVVQHICVPATASVRTPWQVVVLPRLVM